MIADLTGDEEKSYGFVDKIIDGISFSLNTLHVKMRAAQFTASLDLTFLKANSSPPNFKLFSGKKADLRLTRIKSHPFILLFKTISWQTLKMEAKARSKDHPDSDDEDAEKSPRRQRNSDVIRLISSGGSAQLTVKKSLLNREVVCVKSSFVLEDILWLLSATSSQSRDALTLIESISSLVVSQSTASTSSSKKQSDSNGKTSASGPKGSPSKTAAVKVDKNSSLYKIFTQFDPVESCVHINLKTFQLQIVDDMNTQEGSFHSKYPPLEMGSALLFSATGVNFSIYPEYCPRRGFKTIPDEEEDVSLQVLIKLHRMQLHSVGLNDPRMKSRKKQDGSEDKNKYLLSCPSSSNAMPEDVAAVDVIIHHFYDDCDGTKSDSVQIKVGPSRIYVDEPTLLWLHSFILPIIASGQQSGQDQDVNQKTPPFVNVDVEVLLPVLVIDQKNPFAIFPSPFSNKKTVVVDDSQEVTMDFNSRHELEVKATRVTLHRLETKDNDHMAWSFKADPVWAEFLTTADHDGSVVKKHSSQDRLEILEPVSVRGTVLVFSETPVSLEEIRVSIDIESETRVKIFPEILPGLVSFLSKLDVFGDFMAQDKLEMKTCFPLMRDSQLNLKIDIQSLHLKFLRIKAICDDDESSQDNSGSAEEPLIEVDTAALNMRRSYSAPIDVGDESAITVPDEISADTFVSHPLSVERLMDNNLDGNRSSSRTSLTGDVPSRELLNPDLVSLDSRVSDEEDFLILNHMQVPASMSSSPSLILIQDNNNDSDIEEAEDVSALLGADDRLTPSNKHRVQFESVAEIKMIKLVIDKRATDLHSVTEVLCEHPLAIIEPQVEPGTRVPSPTSELPSDGDVNEESVSSCLLVRSELSWSHSKGRSELTSILLEDHPVISIHSKTLEVIASSLESLKMPVSSSPSSSSPAIDIFLRNLTLMILEAQNEVQAAQPKVTLTLPAAVVNKSQENVISVLPVQSVNDSLRHLLEDKHRKVFGTSVVSGFICPVVSSQMKTKDSEEDEEVLKQVLSRNESLEQEVQKLREENELLKKWAEKSAAASNTISRN